MANITNWMGGIYYAKNIINLIMHSNKLRQEYEIHVLVTTINAHVFQEYDDYIFLKEINYGNCYLNSIFFIWYMHKNKIDYWYSLSMNIVERLLVKKAILWIPDFQYLHLPQYFSKFEYNMRDYISRYMACKRNSLVLSSKDACKDFVENYSDYKCKCYVVHFASDIVSEVQAIKLEEENQILHNYQLEEKRYIYIPNQFWQHKNHLTVLQMIEKMSEKDAENILFVFTGQMYDYRNKEYISELQKYFSRNRIKERTKNLGFLNRKEQLVIMKNALFLIQPSLFEGWGTVLEDAKVLDKRVILSDLPVHREQKYEKCVLFQKNNPDDLLEKVFYFMKQQSFDSIDNGIIRFHEDSRKYAMELEKVLL